MPRRASTFEIDSGAPLLKKTKDLTRRLADRDKHGSPTSNSQMHNSNLPDLVDNFNGIISPGGRQANEIHQYQAKRITATNPHFIQSTKAERNVAFSSAVSATEAAEAMAQN